MIREKLAACCRSRRGIIHAATIAVVVGVAAPAARAGGGAENAIVIIDPTNPASLYVGNYYVQARNIPPQNILYLSPQAASFAAFAGFQKEALLGTAGNRAILEHIDFVVIAPHGAFYVPARDLVSDGCSSVTRFSASSAFTMSFIAEDVLLGASSSTRRNHYFSVTAPQAFDSSIRFRNGTGSRADDAERYFIGALLGYDGERGNTIEETIAMIDRAVAADGTHADGTFYYMKTTDPLRSGPRENNFSRAIEMILELGGQAEQIDDVLPLGRHDCLGVMTGWASPDIDGGDFTLLPGAMGDHLTSYAATFDTSGQTKLSRWIVKGAAGSYGTVEEPCNYPGKFPHPFFHVWYYAGLTLGEAGLRSLGYVPFQVLSYGDPLTQPFAYLPMVNVPDFPEGTVSGTIALTPEATTDRPDGAIAGFDLLVGGVLHGQANPGESLLLDTTALPDGPNDVRVIAYETGTVRNQGRFLGTLNVSNSGKIVGLSLSPRTGDRSSILFATIDGGGGPVREVRLMHNERVLASGTGFPMLAAFRAEALGAGVSRVYAVADYLDGGSALSSVLEVTIDYANPPSTQPDTAPPVAYGYTRRVPRNRPILVELPAFDPDDPNLTYEIVAPPAQAAIEGGGLSRLLKPSPAARGADAFTFRAFGNGTASNVATVTLEYGAYVPCEEINKYKTKCRNNKVKVVVIFSTYDNETARLAFAVDGVQHTADVVNRKAKLILSNQPLGDHVIELLDPPNCREPAVVTCGG